MTVGGLTVDVVRKPIKNLHLGVYPPHGRVRVAAPMAVSDDAVRLAVIGRLAWIKRQRAKFKEQPRESRRELVTGESHYFLGQRYRMRVIERAGPGKVLLRGKTGLVLYIGPGSDAAARDRTLQRWYRQQLHGLVPRLLAKWEKKIGVTAAEWRIKRMRTKWGACSIGARRIWLNSELAKKPQRCLEYIIVHELVHLLEPHHGDRFTTLMDRFLPNWAALRAQLASAPLGHEDWGH
jgi:predicted metal-dependent hydrolase